MINAIDYTKDIDAAYRQYLLRPADAAAIAAWNPALVSGYMTVPKMIQAFLVSPEYIALQSNPTETAKRKAALAANSPATPSLLSNPYVWGIGFVLLKILF